ncbi:protein-disulfide reductase DsbD family protein [Simiduia aestuariiviva]|uniref:Thiol:disulfide interchange protein DsbD n=1 Tax=Simiduia aestuariiviva TaxID=1510459 RepID=A0A839UMW1_9GAMM|nr:protein-disulfide reductase DsbD [Simiduia aestuariiviva]MBB3169514.1 thiol:disulfide interchange protein DsbD [Simiduia aestuariiviva]
MPTAKNRAQCAPTATVLPSLRYLILLGLILCQSALAQFSTANNLDQSPEFLPVEEAYQSLPEMTPNGLNIQWQISPGYYLYQERFKIAVELGGQRKDYSPSWPAGKRKYDDYFERELEVYYQQVNIQLPATATPEGQDFILHLESQGCADLGLCYPPRNQRFSFDASSNSFTELPPQLPGPQNLTDLPVADVPTTDTSWLLAVVLAMLGGAILNLMPCVFPVLSIKALSLANSGEDASHRRQHGWAYTAGVVLSFVAIAAALLLVRAGGEAVGWGFQLQSPALVLGLVYLFFILGMALLGVLELGSGLSNVGGKLAAKGGLKGSFFTGMLATLVASPCTAPFMGTALGYAMTQPALASLSVFAALGLGMALPFLALTYVPNLHRWLPKPGAWMETFKELLAFPLLLTAIWLLWVLGRQTGADHLALALCGLLSLGFSLWLWRKRGTVNRLIALAAVALAIYLPANVQEQQDDGWQPYQASSWQSVRAQGRPVFVNVTADWCLTCLANEKLVFSQREVQIEIADADLQLIKADWTRYNPEITQLLAQYQRNGVPLYLMFPANPEADPEVLPQILTPDSFTDALERALSAQ